MKTRTTGYFVERGALERAVWIMRDAGCTFEQISVATGVSVGLSVNILKGRRPRGTGRLAA